ncbi:hypothetical protein M1B34_06335 [Pseudomonas sp. MAFF 302030]|uniref:Uncharacterized protein n=1 Tax=Pseudomonas morbosilactucae TaxID=2938197 RepID=A0A9X1YSG4_9PSED|nr:hypothetical protein [Pseudomonas morbosilactucae]MCK9797370.1 hypothetical protein [Pseudomonas morbosilactucae]
MLVNAQTSSAVQKSQRSDMDPTTAAASAIYSGLMQNVQNAATFQASQAVQKASSTVDDNVEAAFAKTRVLLQATPPATSTPEATTATDASATAEFKEYMSKSPEQRMRDQILKELGITEESLQSMSPEQQLAIGKQIAERMEDKMKLAQADKDNGTSSTGAQLEDKFLASL